MKVNEGGGLEAEQENIEVLEMKYEEAYNKIASGEIKMLKQYYCYNMRR
jgi:hypothetical protein